jgi:transcriptional regulator with XRE-family HTH domain
MNLRRLNELIITSPLNKAQLAERCLISRTTLDNVLSGADAKISTIEALARVLDVSVGYLFDEDDKCNENSSIVEYQAEINRLQTLLDKKHSTKVVVELEVDSDEFIKMGLKDKVVQILER